jgi:hypothetical protein
MRKILIAAAILAMTTTVAGAQETAAGAAAGAATGAIVGGPPGAIIGGAIGGTVGAAAESSKPDTVIVAPEPSTTMRNRDCVTDSVGVTHCRQNAR